MHLYFLSSCFFGCLDIFSGQQDRKLLLAVNYLSFWGAEARVVYDDLSHLLVSTNKGDRMMFGWKYAYRNFIMHCKKGVAAGRRDGKSSLFMHAPSSDICAS